MARATFREAALTASFATVEVLRGAPSHGGKAIGFIKRGRQAPTPTIVLFAMMTSASAALAALEDENLLTPLPDGFKVGFHEANARQSIAEYVPKDETVDDWSRMVTAPIFDGAKNADPDAFAGNLGKK